MKFQTKTRLEIIFSQIDTPKLSNLLRKSTGKTHVGIPKESLKNIKKQIKDIIKQMRASKQAKLIRKLNPVINRWANYYR